MSVCLCIYDYVFVHKCVYVGRNITYMHAYMCIHVYDVIMLSHYNVNTL